MTEGFSATNALRAEKPYLPRVRANLAPPAIFPLIEAMRHSFRFESEDVEANRVKMKIACMESWKYCSLNF